MRAVSRKRERELFSLMTVYCGPQWNRTEEQKARHAATHKAVTHAKAIAEGRDPTRVGRPAILSDDERDASRKVQNRRRSKQTGARIKARREARAIAEGREPGIVGQPRILTDEQRVESRKAVMRRWMQNNPEAVATNSRNRRARKRGNGGKHTRQDIIDLLLEQCGHCAMCGKPFGADGYHVDHIIPLARGGSNGRKNLQLLDPTCNLKKGAGVPEGAP